MFPVPVVVTLLDALKYLGLKEHFDTFQGPAVLQCAFGPIRANCSLCNVPMVEELAKPNTSLA